MHNSPVQGKSIHHIVTKDLKYNALFLHRWCHTQCFRGTMWRIWIHESLNVCYRFYLYWTRFACWFIWTWNVSYFRVSNKRYTIYIFFSAKTLLVVEEFTIPSALLSQNKGGKWKWNAANLKYFRVNRVYRHFCGENIPSF